MSNTTLTNEELLVLGGLLRSMVLVDGDASSEEAAMIEELSASIFRETILGGGTYRTQAVAEEVGDRGALFALMRRAARELPDEGAVRDAARGIARPEARSFILAALTMVATSDRMTERERTLLDWLERTWKTDALGAPKT